MKYVYPAIFYKEKSGGYSVIFPDVEGVVTQGETLYEAMEMAEDALSLMLIEYEEYKGKMKNRIVEPTPIENVKADINESSTSAFVVLIKSDTDNYRQQYENSKHELWHSENTNISFLMLKDDDLTVKNTVEESLRKVSGVIAA